MNDLTKAELIELIEVYSKSWLALDGVWFQSVQRKHEMDEAMFHEEETGKSYAVIEAKRLKEFLKLPERAGLDGLAKALELRLYGNLNAYELILEDKKPIFRNVECRVQTGRKRKTRHFIPANPSA